jgi:Ca-activated chloride channel family protein
VRPQIELNIRDANRRQVDVSLDDFIVLEDGVEQQVEAFQESTAPVSVVLALDSSGSMRLDAPAMIEAARSFVDALPPKDSLGVMTFADKALFVHDLSTDREGALAAIEKYQAVGGTALYDALVASMSRLAPPWAGAWSWSSATGGTRTTRGPVPARQGIWRTC